LRRSTVVANNKGLSLTSSDFAASTYEMSRKKKAARTRRSDLQEPRWPGSQPDASEPIETKRRSSRAVRLVLVVLGVPTIGGGLVLADYLICLPEDTKAAYVGSQACFECHAEETKQWRGSHHDRSMDLATPETVLGDFDGAELTHFGITSRMFRQGDKYMIHTEGPDGTMQDFQIKYVFGVDPLQQYMVEMERGEDQGADEVGRVQVLRVSWDTVRKRWFFLSPPDVSHKLAPSDPLHWTKMGQNWNHMCADCHSTNLHKNHNPKNDTYHTTFSEIHVGCEACHGPGSVHVKLADSKSLFWDRKLGYGLPNLKSRDTHVQMHACFRCHSQRRIVRPDFEAGKNFYDYFANRLLTPDGYHSDGQILGEVYVHGSFIQSLMYHKDVRCTDCHNPHTALPRHEGNTLCTSCHMDSHPAGKYDAPSHHHHKPDGKGALCVECHMPESTYMAIDPRRDHSMKIPRPDLSIRLGTPNTCTRCHLDRANIDPDKRKQLGDYAGWIAAARNQDEEVRRELKKIDQWSLKFMRQWYDTNWQKKPEYATTLSSAWKGDPKVTADLLELAKNKKAPAIFRATAMHELGRFAPDQDSFGAALKGLQDPSPQVRAAAIRALDPEVEGLIEVVKEARDPRVRVPANQRLRRLLKAMTPLLEDPRRLVRIEVARALAPVPTGEFNATERTALEKAADDLKRSLAVNSDQVGSHMTLGILYERKGETRLAAQAYRTAIRIQGDVTGPRSNLAVLLDRLGQQEEAKRLRREELDLLARDVKLLEDTGQENAGLLYRYGMSLYLNDRIEEAEKPLLKATQLEPYSPRPLLALVLLHEKLNRWDDAMDGCRRLLELRPNDLSYRQLLQRLRQQMESQDARQRGP